MKNRRTIKKKLKIKNNEWSMGSINNLSITSRNIKSEWKILMNRKNVLYSIFDFIYLYKHVYNRFHISL